jgi:DNA-binding MarR family transcriptional regulator
VREGRARLDRNNLGYLLAKASQRWNELLYARFVRQGFADVRPAYGSVLVPLFEEDGLRMGELARRARLSKQTMTTLVRHCERARLVRREKDQDDGRAFRIWLTERGHAVHPVAQASVTEIDDLVATELNRAELETLKQSLRGVVQL